MIVFRVIYTSLSLLIQSCREYIENFVQFDEAKTTKIFQKSSWQAERFEILYKSWLAQRSYKKLTELLQAVDEGRGSVPWKLNNAIRNHAHMISSQMLDFVSAMRMQNINKTRFVRNTIWNSITWIILRAIQVLQYIIYWRVWSWLRTNAGGVLNTCKSNGAKW